MNIKKIKDVMVAEPLYQQCSNPIGSHVILVLLLDSPEKEVKPDPSLPLLVECV
jgi:hypothetical protein